MNARLARPVSLIHPSTLRAYAEAFGWKLKDGRVPVGSAWKCQVCGERGHVGRCDEDALARAEANLRQFFKIGAP